MMILKAGAHKLLHPVQTDYAIALFVALPLILGMKETFRGLYMPPLFMFSHHKGAP